MKIKDCVLVEVFSCAKSASVVEVAKLMRDHRQRHIVVVDSGKPVGMISNVDIINKVVADNKDPAKLIADKIMVSPVDTVDVDDEVSDAYFKMASRNTFSCPVTENGKLKSLLTFNEALKSMIQTKGVDQDEQTI